MFEKLRVVCISIYTIKFNHAASVNSADPNNSVETGTEEFLLIYFLFPFFF